MKKVLYTMAMFSMVAMFAACGGSDNKDAKEGENGKGGAAGSTPASVVEPLAKKACECTKIEDEAKKEECLQAAAEEIMKAGMKYKEDKEAMKEFREAGEKITKECGLD